MIRLSRRRWIWTGTAATVVLIAAIVLLQRTRGPEAVAADTADESGVDDRKAVPVELATARSVDLPSYFNATGTLEAQRTVELIAKVEGQITELGVEEGDRVREGRVLLEIDPREQSLRTEEARVRAETAASELTRIEDMAQRGLESERALETARQDHAVRQAEYELERVRLDAHSLKAPFGGRLTARKVELGQTVQAGTALLILADVEPLEVNLHLPEQVVGSLAEGQTVEIRADVAPGSTLQGRVERIAAVVDPATSTVKVTLRVDELAAGVRVGSFVRARITTDVHLGAVAVPRKALVEEAGASFLFVAEADSVRKVEVQTGYADEEWIEIASGVAIGERIVVVGQGGLRTGSRVEDLAATQDQSEPESETADTTGSDGELASLP
jgi:membrane fusion protein (multidrug efflux system)